MTQRLFDDPAVLRRRVTPSTVLHGIDSIELGSGDAWVLGEVGILKDYPAFETSDLPRDLMQEAEFRTVTFEFPEDGRRGVAALLAYARDGERVFEVFAGWVPDEESAQLGRWVAFLNAEIKRTHLDRTARGQV